MLKFHLIVNDSFYHLNSQMIGYDTYSISSMILCDSFLVSSFAKNRLKPNTRHLMEGSSPPWLNFKILLKSLTSVQRRLRLASLHMVLTCLSHFSCSYVEILSSASSIMADDFDVEAMLEAPYRKEVSWYRVLVKFIKALTCSKNHWCLEWVALLMLFIHGFSIRSEANHNEKVKSRFLKAFQTQTVIISNEIWTTW